ncbi:MAG: hypothetical protein R3Y56_09450 [Akkermansia sp.]
MPYSDSLAGTLNLDGKLIIQSNLGIQNKGEASSISINNGACLQLNYGLTALGDQVAGGTSITVNKGATLALGNLASNAAVASTALLDVTIKDGATIAAYGNDATVTVAHQFDYELGAAITLQTQQNQTLEMTQALAKVDSVTVQGGGTVQLTGGATLSSSELQDTTLRISNTKASIDQITLHDNDLFINGTTLSSSELTTSEQSTITLQ